MGSSSLAETVRPDRAVIHKVTINPGTALAVFGTMTFLGIILAFGQRASLHGGASLAPSAASLEGRPHEGPLDEVMPYDGASLSSADELMRKIKALEELESRMETAAAQQIIELYERLHSYALAALGLSGIEMRIALSAITGASNLEIASRLHLTESAVKHRLSDIFKKTGTSSRHALREKALSFLPPAAPERGEASEDERS